MKEKIDLNNPIEAICNWNQVVGNTNFNYWLEAQMLGEEFAETIVALKNRDKVEAVDWILDIFFVGIGTLYKLGVSPDEINECLSAIILNNYSKLHYIDGKFSCIRDNNWKIIKPDDFVKVDLASIIK